MNFLLLSIYLNQATFSTSRYQIELFLATPTCNIDDHYPIVITVPPYIQVGKSRFCHAHVPPTETDRLTCTCHTCTIQSTSIHGGNEGSIDVACYLVYAYMCTCIFIGSCLETKVFIANLSVTGRGWVNIKYM